MNVSFKKRSGIVTTALIIVISISGVAIAQDTVVNEASGKEYREGLELYKKRQYDGALPHFVKAYELDERNVAALFAEGLVLNSLKRYKEAAEILKATIAKDPTHEKALKLFPIVLERDKQTDAAIAAYDKSIASFPKDADLYLGKARVYMGLQKHKEALENLDKALSLNPDDQQTMLFRAQTLVTLGKNEEAFKTAAVILEKNPNHSRAMVIVADYKRQQGLLDDALALYTKASKNIDTKAYAEHYIEVIKQQKEEDDIEREYQERLKKEQKKTN